MSAASGGASTRAAVAVEGLGLAACRGHVAVMESARGAVLVAGRALSVAALVASSSGRALGALAAGQTVGEAHACVSPPPCAASLQHN